MASQPKSDNLPMNPSDEERSHEQMQLAVMPLLNDLIAKVGEAVSHRKNIEERWLEDIRQFHGIYDPLVANVLRNTSPETEKDDAARSKIFINITRPKTNAWNARLGDMLFPNDEKNWGINPTPAPDLTKEAKAHALEAEALEQEAKQKTEQYNEQAEQEGAEPSAELHQQADAAAQRARAMRDKERETQAILDEARERASKMETEIKDQLVECRYAARCRDVIDDFCKIGVGILKGPIVSGKPRRQWSKQTVIDNETGQSSEIYELAKEDAPRPSFRRVNPWHFFPEPSAECVEDAEYLLERHLPNKKMLRKMARDLDFYPDAVRKLLKEGTGTGHGSSMQHFGLYQQLRAIDGTGTDADTLDSLSERYIIWEYHGALENEQVADMMRATGRVEEANEFMRDADPIETRMVRVFFCDMVLLKIEEEYLLDSGESLYSVASFEKSESSILGSIGVPRLMRSEQAMLNSAVRMMMDNAALAVGPQLVIDKEAIQPENGSWRVTPRKVWQRIKAYVGADTRGNRPFETYDIPMNQEMLSAIIQLALRFVDEAVAMPLIAQGEQGEHITQTKGGMTMLFNSANVVFRRVVKNWDDDITSGAIGRAYDFNMQFSKKPEIKGDMKVEARGTSVLLVREMQAEQLLSILDRYATHPILGVAVKAYNCMKLVLQAMSINPNDVLEDLDTYLEKLKTMGEDDDQTSPEEIRAQSALQVAEIDANSRREVAASNERIAQLRTQQAFAELGSRHDLTLAQIQAMFEGKKLDAAVRLQTEDKRSQSKERTLAAEVAVERENKREAEAKGLVPTGSGGAISAGAKAA